MFRFAHDIALYALALVPLVLLLFWLDARWRKQALAQLGDGSVVDALMPLYSPARRRWKRAFQIIAIGCIIIGIANPQVGSKYEEVKRQGFELMICIGDRRVVMFPSEDVDLGVLNPDHKVVSGYVERDGLQVPFAMVLSDVAAPGAESSPS